MGRGWPAGVVRAAIGVTAVLVSAASAVVVLRGHTAAEGFWGSSPVVALGLAVGVVAAVSLALVLARHDVVVARWGLACAAWLSIWSASLAGSTLALATPAPRAEVWSWPVLVAHSGHIPLIPLVQCLLVVAVSRLGGRTVPFVLPLLVAVPVLALLTGAAVGDFAPPFETTPPPWDDVGRRVPAATVAFDLLVIPWFACVFVAPVLAWWAVGHVAGSVRRSVVVVAVAALLPCATVLTCLALLPTLMELDLPQDVAVDVPVLLAAMMVPLTTGGVVLAARVDQRNLRDTGPALRRAVATASAIALGLVVIGVAGLVAAMLAPWSVTGVLFATALVTVAAVPVHRRLVARLVRYADPAAARLGDLLAASAVDVRVNPAVAAPGILRDVLHDEDLQVAYRLPDDTGWRDPHGAPVLEPTPGPRTTLVPDASGRIVAAVSHTAPTAEVAGCVAALGDVLEKGALETTVREQQRRLARHRADVAAAAEEERHRIERDLHDTVQGRLLAVALQLQAGQRETADPMAHLAMNEAVDGLRSAIHDLRGIAAGELPALLAREGLAPALTDLAHRLPVPVHLSLPATRLPPDVEVTAYRVLSEALTNVVKHAGPCQATVEVTRLTDAVSIRVTDSGVGGADLRAGSGLRGLQERVAAAGGILVVSEAPEHGTAVEVLMPCAR